MTALFDVIDALACIAPYVSITFLGVMAAACLAWLAWADRGGSR